MQVNLKLWSQQLSIMIFQLVVLIVISQLYGSNIDQVHELQIKLWLKYCDTYLFSENMDSQSSWYWLHILKGLAPF